MNCPTGPPPYNPAYPPGHNPANPVYPAAPNPVYPPGMNPAVQPGGMPYPGPGQPTYPMNTGAPGFPGGNFSGGYHPGPPQIPGGGQYIPGCLPGGMAAGLAGAGGVMAGYNMNKKMKKKMKKAHKHHKHGKVGQAMWGILREAVSTGSFDGTICYNFLYSPDLGEMDLSEFSSVYGC